jgi:hypothetical protein
MEKNKEAAVLETTASKEKELKQDKVNCNYALNTHKIPVPVITPKYFTGENKLNSNTPDATNNNAKALESFDPYRITKELNIPNPAPVITIGEAPVAAAGNITPITAEGKGGKTALRSAILAGAISKTGVIDGFPDIHVQPNINGQAVIDIDTEQSPADHQYNLKKSLDRCGLSETPEYLRSYNIRTLPLSQCQELINMICEACDQAFNGTHLIIIDGGADCISSVNDEAEANGFINF